MIYAKQFFGPLVAILALATGHHAGSGVQAADAPNRRTENVLLVTFDGFRWQELFTGADESLINKEFGGVKRIEETHERYWRPTPEERRQVLLPFFWSKVAVEGKVYGNPEHQSVSRVTNGMNFSYPGYNEILTGHPDPRVDSNDKKPNPNINVLEWLNTLDAFHGRVAAFTSWDVFPFIINEERSGVPVNAAWEPLTDGKDAELLNRIGAEMPLVFPGVRLDYFTFRGAEEYIKAHQPRVMYVSFDETDDWAHARRYDTYLEAAQRNDNYVRQLWELVQSLPEYAGKTSLVMTTDHGRGETKENWTSHGDEHPGSDLMWIAVLGPDTPAGPVSAGIVTQSQVAATVAALLGENYNAAVPEAAQPLPGAIKSE
ncbi:MAG: alkaline phosphatase family protein [Planctomycetaceae bacterium]